jgi:callose synthase
VHCGQNFHYSKIPAPSIPLSSKLCVPFNYIITRSVAGPQYLHTNDYHIQKIINTIVSIIIWSLLQLGLLIGLPMVMELGLEKGFCAALSDFILMQLQLASVFFTFSLGTKAHYYGRTIIHGGAKYRPTRRKFVVFHASFTENYQLYSRTAC